MPAPQEPQQQAPMEMSSTSAPSVVTQQPAAEPQPDMSTDSIKFFGSPKLPGRQWIHDFDGDNSLAGGKSENEGEHLGKVESKKKHKRDDKGKGKAKDVSGGDGDSHAEGSGSSDRGKGPYKYFKDLETIPEETCEE
ncbi:hypothetical protein F5Y12DRAFT_258185 [Xylaria sp. FL1777]|nr:hypothetical protein F5Y12DRAFT_258185 [Xylaria sp. FL1777]